MNINKVIFNSAIWSWVMSFGNQGISFLVFLVVARFIGPEQYGLASICFVILACGSIILNGLGEGVVVFQERDENALSTLFWTTSGVSVVFSVSCYFLSGPTAAFFNLPALDGLMRFFSPIFILFGAGVLPNKIIYANMNFHLFAIRSLIASCISAVVGIYMAYKGMGAYAIIGQQLSLYLVMSLVAWLVIDWRPRRTFLMSALVRLMPPGFKAMGTETLEFLDQQLPRFLIGRIAGPISLGYFSFASRIKYAIQDVIINPPLIVIYPAVTKVDGNKDMQSILVGRVLLAIGSIVFPFVTLSVLLAPLYVPIFFGEKWIGATSLLQILIIGCLVIPFNIVTRELFRANNKLGVFIKLQISVLPITMALYVFLLPYGIEPLALGLLLLSFIVMPVQMVMLARHLGVNLASSLITLLKPLVLSLLMGIFVYFMRSFGSSQWPNILSLFYFVFLGGVNIFNYVSVVF